MLLQQALLPQTTACMGCVPSVMEKAIVAAANGDAQAVAAWLDEGGGVDAGCAERKGEMLLMAAAHTLVINFKGAAGGGSRLGNKRIVASDV